MVNVIRSRLPRYGAAVLSVTLALLLTQLLGSPIQLVISPLFFAAVMCTAWYGGLKPGLLSTVLAILAIDYFLMPPLYSLALGDGADIVQPVVFSLVALLLGLLNAQVRTAKQSTEASLSNLQASEDRYRRLIDTACEGIWLVDADLRTEYANQQLAEMLGYSIEEMLGRSIYEFMDRESRLEAESKIERRKQGIREQFDFRYQRKDGSDLWAIVSTSPILDRQGKFNGALAMLTDITDRKQIEESLREANQLVPNILESITDAFFAVDRQWRFIYVNRRCEELMRHSREQLLGQCIWEVFPQAVESVFYEQYHRAISEQIAVNCEAPAPDSSGRWFEARAYPLMFADGLAVYFQDISDRKRIEDELQDALQRLTFHVENSPLAVIEWNRDFRISRWSKSAEKIFGWTAEEVMGRNLSDRSFIFANDVKAVDLVIERLFNGIEQQNASCNRNYTKTGSIVHCEWYNSGLRDEFGNLVSVLSLVLDVTERKQAEDTLRYLAETSTILSTSLDYETTLERVAQIAVPHLADWCTVDILQDDGSLRRMPVAHADPSKVEWARLLQQYIPDANSSHPIARVLQTGRSELIPEVPEDLVVAATPDAKHLQVASEMGIKSIMVVPLVAQQRLLGAIAFASAESGRRYNSADLALAEDLTRRAALAIDNARLYEAEQRARAEAVREAERSAAANRVKDEFLAVLSHELRTPLNPLLGWVRLLRTRQFDAAMSDRALEIIERNAKLQTQLIDDLLDVSRILRGKLSLNIGPVNLVATIEAAIETVHLAAEAKSIQIQSSIDAAEVKVLGDPNRLQQVVWNLLSNAVKFTPPGGQVEIRLSKVRGQLQRTTESEQRTTKNAGKAEGSRELRELCTQVPEKFSAAKRNVETSNGTSVQESQAPSQNLSPSSSSPPTSPTLFVDYAQIQVSDTGKGINPDFLPYVFDYFRQADSTTTRIFGGLGLGLAIVRHLVELHGGSVSAESPGEGRGATFTVRVPLMTAVRQTTEDDELPENSPNLEGVRILVVDDEGDTLELLVFILEQYGAVVRAVASAGEVLEVFAQFQPDLLLSDIGMPNVDGYRLIRQIRAMPPEQGGQIPAIALTACAGETDHQQLLKAGFQRHLTKPVEPGELAVAIANLLLTSSSYCE